MIESDTPAQFLAPEQIGKITYGEPPVVHTSLEPVEAEVSDSQHRFGLAARAIGAVAGAAFLLTGASNLVAADKAEAATLPDGHSFVNPDNFATHPAGQDSGVDKFTRLPEENMKTAFAIKGANSREDTFRVMTYNILRSGKYFGEKSTTQTDKVSYMLMKKAERAWGGPYARVQRAAEVIDTSGAQIVGLQEAAPQQIGWLKKLLSRKGFESYPKNMPVETSILVDTDRFEVEKTQILRNPTYPDRPGKKTGFITVLKLKDKLTGAHIWTMNSHPVAHDTAYDRGGAVKRWFTNKIKVRFWKRLLQKDPEANGIDIGDNNSTNMLRLVPDKYTPIVKDTWLKLKFGAQARTKLAYCMLTQKGLLKDPSQPLFQDSLDEVRGIKGWCKDRSMAAIRHFNVDWIYKTKNLTVTKWRQIWTKPALTASDHKPVIAEMFVKDNSV